MYNWSETDVFWYSACIQVQGVVIVLNTQKVFTLKTLEKRLYVGFYLHTTISLSFVTGSL